MPIAQILNLAEQQSRAGRIGGHQRTGDVLEQSRALAPDMLLTGVLDQGTNRRIVWFCQCLAQGFVPRAKGRLVFRPGRGPGLSSIPGLSQRGLIVGQVWEVMRRCRSGAGADAAISS